VRALQESSCTRCCRPPRLLCAASSSPRLSAIRAACLLAVDAAVRRTSSERPRPCVGGGQGYGELAAGTCCGPPASASSAVTGELCRRGRELPLRTIASSAAPRPDGQISDPPRRTGLWPGRAGPPHSGPAAPPRSSRLLRCHRSRHAALNHGAAAKLLPHRAATDRRAAGGVRARGDVGGSSEFGPRGGYRTKLGVHFCLSGDREWLME